MRQLSLIVSAAVALALVVPAASRAQQEGHSHHPAPAPSAAEPGEQHHHQAPATPEATVEAFHGALAGGDRDHALAFLAPDVVIFESGGAEMSRDEYASHHLESDMAFSKAVAREVSDQRSASHGSVAWVLTRSTSAGTYREREIHSRGTETMVLHRTEAGWQIVHIHWSSGAIGK